MAGPPETIVCVECGGTAHLASFLPDDEPVGDGYPVAYTCADCLHRHDLVWEDEPDD